MDPEPVLTETPTQPPSHRHQIALIIPLGFRSSAGSSNESETGSNGSQRPRALLLVIMSDDSFTPSSEAGDDDSTFHNLLNRFFQSYQPRGPPPASQKMVDRLPTVIMDEQVKAEAIRCTVCMDDFELGSDQVVIKLPCSHVLHKDCVTPWLKEHNTCPVCRYELPVEDAEYEKDRKERMAGRANIDEESFFNANSEHAGDDDDELPELVQADSDTQGDNTQESEGVTETTTEDSMPRFDFEWLLQRTEELRQRHEQQQQQNAARQALVATPTANGNALPTALPRARPSRQGFFARKWKSFKKALRRLPCAGTSEVDEVQPLNHA